MFGWTLHKRRVCVQRLKSVVFKPDSNIGGGWGLNVFVSADEDHPITNTVTNKRNTNANEDPFVVTASLNTSQYNASSHFFTSCYTDRNTQQNLRVDSLDLHINLTTLRDQMTLSGYFYCIIVSMYYWILSSLLEYFYSILEANKSQTKHLHCEWIYLNDILNGMIVQRKPNLWRTNKEIVYEVYSTRFIRKRNKNVNLTFETTDQISPDFLKIYCGMYYILTSFFRTMIR